MHPITWLVLLLATATTAWLVVYVRVYLPRKLEDQYRESVRAFCTAIELRCPTHKGLSVRVAAISRAVGQKMGLSPHRLIDLEMAANLRDIGLCAVPYGLVNDKTPEDWTAAENYIYERHPEVSGAMLELVPHLRHLAPIVRNHHVEFQSDDSVSGVLRSQVPLESFILNAVTAYVWEERWKGGLLARDHVRECRGTVYEPRVVDALFEVLPSLRVGESRVAPTFK